jgi:hypothetical protein
MKTYGEWKYSVTISDLGTTWRYVVSFTPRPFLPGETSLNTRCIEVWVSPIAKLNVMEKRKPLAFAGNRIQIPRSSSLYTD